MRKYYETSKDNRAGKQHRKDLCRMPCSVYWGTVQSYKTWGSHHLRECDIICVIPFSLFLLCPVNDILISIWQSLIAFPTGVHNKHLHHCITLRTCWMREPSTGGSSSACFSNLSVPHWMGTDPLALQPLLTVWCTFCPIIQIISVDVKQDWPSIDSWGTLLVISLQLDVPIDHKPLGPAM